MPLGGSIGGRVDGPAALTLNVGKLLAAAANSFDETQDGIGNPVKNTPLCRQNLAARFGTAGELAILDDISNASYTTNLERRHWRLRTSGLTFVLSWLRGDLLLLVSETLRL